MLPSLAPARRPLASQMINSRYLLLKVDILFELSHSYAIPTPSVLFISPADVFNSSCRPLRQIERERERPYVCVTSFVNIFRRKTARVNFSRAMLSNGWRSLLSLAILTDGTNTGFASLRRFYTRKEGNVLFNEALNTFYLQLYGVRHGKRVLHKCKFLKGMGGKAGVFRT